MITLKKLAIFLICSLLILTLFGCSKSENNDIGETSSTSASYSEREQLESLLEMISPITDYSFYGLLNDFFSNAISTVLSPSDNSTKTELESLQQSILGITEPIISAEVPTGYALEAIWNELVSKCVLTNQYIKTSMNAIEDNDSYTVLETKDLCGNMDTLEKALAIKNILTKNISNLKEQESKKAIEIKADYAECEEKALRYARYFFENSDVTEINGSEEPVTFDDIPGKHFVFTVPNEENVWILISVEDKSIICRQKTPNGYSNNFVNDGQLPAEEGDLVMPDVIGMEKEEAIRLIEGMGLEIETGIMDLDNVESGLICHCYPSPGNLLTEDTVVHLHIEK